MDEEVKVSSKVQEMVNQAFNCQVKSSVELTCEQLAALQNLNEFCVNLAVENDEVVKNPLKISYKTNEYIKQALVAICLSYSLVNPRRKMRENKDFFEKNIMIYQKNHIEKLIDFGNIVDDTVTNSIYWEIVEDWKLYVDKDCGGIKALIDEKTNLIGLDNYARGGDPLYEFARFHRKYTEKEKVVEEKSRIAAKDAFRGAVLQSVASEIAKKQLEQGKDPMEVIESLLGDNFSLTDNSKKRSPQPNKQKQIVYKPKKK